MIVYITKTFENILDKSFSNYFIDLDKFSQELKKSFINNIYLKRPIMKFKIKLNWVSYRVVWLIKWNIILPILIYLKKDKKSWDNIIWNKELKILINHYSSKMEFDIKNNFYSKF